MIGIINLNKIFFIVFSFYSFKFNSIFEFFFKYLSEEYFINKIIRSKIIFKDSVVGLISILSKY
jgi:hypothetical protein